MLQELIEKKRKLAATTSTFYLKIFWQIIVKKRASNCIMKNTDWTVLLNIIY